MPVRLYGRYRNSGEAAIRLNTTINGRPLETGVAMEFPKEDDSNPEIERMWA